MIKTIAAMFSILNVSRDLATSLQQYDNINSFQAKFSFLHPLKKLENLEVSWRLSVVQNENINLKRVN